MADTDPLAAELAAIRKRADGATAGPWRPMDGKLIVETEAVAPRGIGGDGLTTVIATLYMTVGSYWPERRNTEFIAAARSDVPRLLAAVEAVLGAHHDSGGRCAWCRNPDGSRQKWPCGEYLTITRALTGEDSSDE